MKVIVGLGNPGREYERTRHNAGFLVLDRLAGRHAQGQIPRAKFQAAVMEAPIAGERCLLMKPTTYMNRSGGAVAQATRFYKIDPSEDLLIIVDDTALPFGTIRIRPKGGAGGHNGLADIQRALGTDSFARLRVGVGAAVSSDRQVGHVLGRFGADEWDRIGDVVDQAMNAVEMFINEGVMAAMNTFNTRASQDDQQDTDEIESPKPTRPGNVDPGWTGGSKQDI